MYEHAVSRTDNTTRLVGMVITGVVVASVVYGLVFGLGNQIYNAVTKTEVAIVEAPEIEEEEPPPPPPVDVELPPPPPQVVLPDFIVDAPPPPNAIRQVEATPNPQPRPEPRAVPPPAPKPTVAQRPQVGRRFEKPPYPPTALRAKQEGETVMTLCVDARGSVTDVKLKRSAGSDALDQAAMKHVRGERMQPAKDTANQNVEFCGWDLTIQWKLEDAR
jgi:periplasmic protein TonB